MADGLLKTIVEQIAETRRRVDRIEQREHTSGSSLIRWEPLTNSDPSDPQLVFDPANGDVIMVAM